ncbi:MAG: hypothetical protein JW760_14940 [Spirochaetales bacterium]|nr:hypothetical protein [Spirochaetales bacterium]
MLGIPDVSVLLAYILVIALTLFGAVYGFIKWNKDGDLSEEELETEKFWMEEETELEEEVDGGMV